MNRPLTVLGAERRLFFVALISGGAIFSLLHSLFGGIGLFIVGVIIARIATKHDVEILRVLFNSGKFRRRYDPMKADTMEPSEISLTSYPSMKARMLLAWSQAAVHTSRTSTLSSSSLMAFASFRRSSAALLASSFCRLKCSARKTSSRPSLISLPRHSGNRPSSFPSLRLSRSC
jgi:type IV secretory pathway TrbD component